MDEDFPPRKKFPQILPGKFYPSRTVLALTRTVFISPVEIIRQKLLPGNFRDWATSNRALRQGCTKSTRKLEAAVEVLINYFWKNRVNQL